MNKPDGYIEPSKIFENLYFVGTIPASTHILDTGDGLIMFDSGYQHSLYLVIHNMHLLGLNPLNLKYIIHTHGHIDHFGATKSLVELTGAKTFIGRADKDYCNGKLDLSYAKELNMEFNETFEPDFLLDDGSVIELGNTKIKAVATPGHTAGAMSYFFNVSDGENTFRVGLHGGMGVNSLQKWFLDKYNLPYSLRDDFKKSMNRLNEEKVDIFLGNHCQHNHTIDKIEKFKNGDKFAFVNPSEWGPFNLCCIENLENLVKKENS
jgi:metallo-beta-lactamase class B